MEIPTRHSLAQERVNHLHNLSPFLIFVPLCKHIRGLQAEPLFCLPLAQCSCYFFWLFAFSRVNIRAAQSPAK